MKYFITIGILLIASISAQADKIRVVTTTQDLADMTAVIGGEKVSVTSLTNGDQDPHHIEPRPSMVMKVKNADLLVRIGMDLDIWVQSLIDMSRNARVAVGGQGYLDASTEVERLEVPTGKVDQSMGDIHIYGNPHYWLDPENGKRMVTSIAERLIRLNPPDSAYFSKNRARYIQSLDSAMTAWRPKLETLAGMKVVTFHNSWPYFAARLKLNIVGFIEPKPGIPPGPAHLAAIMEKMRNGNVAVIIMEPFYDRKTAARVATGTGAKVVVLPSSTGGMPGTHSYFALMEYNIDALYKAVTQ